MPRLNTAIVMDNGMETWMKRTAQKNLWRVAGWLDIEDLLQEGYAAWVKTREYYGDTVKNRSHFMALFKTIYGNRINDLANSRSILGKDEIGVECAISQIGPLEGREGWMDALIGSCEQDGPLVTLMKEARFPVRPLIELFTTEQGAEILRQYPQRRRETLNSYLCRLISVDPASYDLPELFRSFVSGFGVYYLRVPAAPLSLVG